MATVGDLLATKGHGVVAVQPSDTVLQAANLLNDLNIGGVVVLEGDRLAGIFTERDVLRRVVAQELDPAITPVAEVMTTPVVTCEPDLSLDDCAALMTGRTVRHLPVQVGTGLVGLLSIRDLLAYKVNEQQATLDQMTSYLYDLR
jgi:CBS domain-containing protein